MLNVEHRRALQIPLSSRHLRDKKSDVACSGPVVLGLDHDQDYSSVYSAPTAPWRRASQRLE